MAELSGYTIEHGMPSEPRDAITAESMMGDYQAWQDRTRASVSDKKSDKKSGKKPVIFSAYDADAGEEIEVSLVGVYALPKSAGAIAEGAKAYWDTTAKAVTTTASGNKLIGACILGAGNGEATARIRLDGTAI